LATGGPLGALLAYALVGTVAFAVSVLERTVLPQLGIDRCHSHSRHWAK